MSGRTIEIDVLINDKTNGGVKGIQKELQALDKQAERLNQRIKAVGLQKFAATLRLIDKVSDPASRINSLLKKIAGGTYRVTMRINDSALAGIRKIESALLRISGRAWNVAVNVKGAAMNKINGMMSGALMGAGVFAPMAGMMGVGYGVGNAISSAAGFEQEMSRVQAIRQLSKDSQDMKDMYALAKKLGMETAWTRQQVAEGMRYQALAGWETPQILKATPHMLNLASAGGMDLGAASDMLTDAMTAFGLKATDQYTNAKGQAIDLPEYFADMFAKVQASSNTDLYQLKEATKYSASTIGTMFANIGGQEGVQARTEAARQMLIMAGLMANAGIKGSMAGTGINTIFNRLAGENRNTHFAEKLLGLEHAAENGNMLMPLDFIKAFRNKIQGGMSVDDFLQVAEELSGEKIHADTRRKINSTIENALKNGGKLGSSDMLKIGSMMAGLENAPKLMAMVFQDIEALEAKMNNVEGTAGQMANDMLDNLAGSFTRLGSAWDAFQQDLFTGTAGDGLRNFVDALTEILTRANNLFKDGIDISDFGKIIGDVVGRLKDKVMELDGIGSLLAGGALVMGLKKIISLGQSALNVFKGVGAAGATALGGTAAKGAAGAAAVGTMTIHANVVNLNGAVRGGYGYGGGGGRGGYGYGGGAAGAAASPMAAMLAAQKQFDKTNAQFLAAQAKRDAKWGKVEQLFAAGGSDSQLARARATARKFDETRYLPALERQQAAQKALVAARV
ncbi:MAG: phage tail tape measure protein, partial [Selenomonadaceae bacterium]|nr:phage tail tape measure protein [Clostridia bacterium]MBR3497796.1 phage tail tape measure protein [Selenomonadaceae bacterium]